MSSMPTQPPDASRSVVRASSATSGHAVEKALDLEIERVTVRTTEPLRAGQVVMVNLRLPGGVRIKTLARAIEPSGERKTVELELIEVYDERTTKQLDEYIAQESMPPVRISSWLAGVRVLVVDDDKSYRELVARVMEEAGFEVVTAHNGFEALSLALKHPPNLVLTDVTMPGMDGWHFLRLIRARPTLRRTPVMFLTELNSESERLRGYSLGVDDYLAKPFDNLELIARVERVLERANAAEQAAAGGVRGDLAQVSLASLLSLAEMERRTGVLQLEGDGNNATLHLRDGAVVRIDLPDPHDQLPGRERFFHVLDWSGGRFELIATDVLAEDVIRMQTSHALLEHARRQDEAEADSKR
jgi:DNA-binding response OmpR family regulator